MVPVTSLRLQIMVFLHFSLDLQEVFYGHNFSRTS